MTELFKTVLVLSIFGTALTALLLVLKPLTSKKLPAAWQYYMWISVMLSMLIPVYKIIPSKEIYKLPVVPSVVTESDVAVETDEQNEATPPANEEKESTNAPIRQSKTGIYTFATILWLSGIAVYILIVTSSYISFILRKRKDSFPLQDCPVFKEARMALKIRRKMRVRITKTQDSPMLVGVLFPVIYIPDAEIPKEKLKMIYLHELTHFKRRDLIFKWLSVLTNAIHWFNPLSYFLCFNLSESCEISCDMAVTKNMTEDEQKLYMQTILDLAKRR